jgi:hypothetical protein
MSHVANRPWWRLLVPVVAVLWPIALGTPAAHADTPEPLPPELIDA